MLDIQNKRILLIGGKGGHGEQLKRIRALLNLDCVHVITETGMQWDVADDNVLELDRVVDYHQKSTLKSVRMFVIGFFKAFSLIKQHNFDLAVSTGPAMSVPVCLACKILRVKVIHIESWSRISSISNSTKILHRFNLANTVVYQYPEHQLAGKKNCEYWGHL